MKVAAIDTNLLLLLVVGRTARSYIAKHKRLQEYSEADFDLLVRLLSSVGKLIVTPHILTETSNLTGQIKDPYRARIRSSLKALIVAAEEDRKPSIELVEHPSFAALGLTDVALLSLSVPDCTVLTVDLDLWAAARKQGLRAQNFNHLREQAKTI